MSCMVEWRSMYIAMQLEESLHLCIYIHALIEVTVFHSVCIVNYYSN